MFFLFGQKKGSGAYNSWKKVTSGLFSSIQREKVGGIVVLVVRDELRWVDPAKFFELIDKVCLVVVSTTEGNLSPCNSLLLLNRPHDLIEPHDPLILLRGEPDMSLK